jgi:hypothetical protein
VRRVGQGLQICEIALDIDVVGNCLSVSELIQDDGQSDSDPANRLQSLTVGKLPSREGQAGQVTYKPVSRELRFERRKPCVRVADYTEIWGADVEDDGPPREIVRQADTSK